MKTLRLCLAMLLAGMLLLTSCVPAQPIALRLTPDMSLRLSGRYSRLPGTKSKTLKLDQGDEVSVTYEFEVVSGTFELAVKGPDETEVWHQGFEEDAADTFTFTAPAEGEYVIRINFDGLEGSYRVSCQLAESDTPLPPAPGSGSL